MTIKAPHPTYLGPAAHTSGPGNKPIKHITIHSTVSPCVPGGARNIAAYFRTEASGGSAHYIVDPKEVIQSVYDDVIAWHAPPNEGSIGIEMCDIPSATSKARWANRNQLVMLNRTAKLTARLCLHYKVPINFLTVAELKAGKPGITTHHNVSMAFHQSTHWDPGKWPEKTFMRLVHHHAKRIKAKEGK